ncbi:hypothetical protein MesoLjLc_41070 [Mesorhizobium sp. L-8-10]|uniref:hypothetical protein n=1 Tax=unclassified Mesorhizobium TaxID=325217 RepID=UPI0019280E6D|nr:MULTISPECIES: hypothetical protein [unclassified Mesorhizobium]BCH24442.1 hypothetical protein MesoLjLb_42270 [Mesorhizobium sp. L-8-3]BCH32177.1 hypothetical protein MesoLjLc_41070 [Mesorhizobium sp. L-8-10]
MPLYTHDQSPVGQKACGASCILCAANELGVRNGPITDPDAAAMWQRIWKGPQDESLISRVASELARLRLTAVIIQDKSKTSSLRQGQLSSVFEPAYQAFKADVKNVVTWDKRPGPNAFLDSDFDSFARVMLVVSLANGLTHWVLARRYNGAIQVMNPDGGTDTVEQNLVNWMNGPPVPRTIGNVDYVFTGIALSVTRTPR